jgi:WD40 repeat protein
LAEGRSGEGGTNGNEQKIEAEKQQQDAVAAQGNLETNTEEAARTDRLVAEENLQRGANAEALAHLARASHYTQKSSLPAEVALPLVLSSPSRAVFQVNTNSASTGVFSPDGRRVLTSEDNTAQLWEADNGKLLVTFQGHIDMVYSAVFSPDGQRVLTASEDKTARLWETDSGKLLAIFQGHTGQLMSTVFSPDGRRVLTASADTTVQLSEADSGRVLTVFQGLLIGGYWDAVFNPDGRRVQSCAGDGTARLWEADSGKLSATFQGFKATPARLGAQSLARSALRRAEAAKSRTLALKVLAERRMRSTRSFFNFAACVQLPRSRPSWRGSSSLGLETIPPEEQIAATKVAMRCLSPYICRFSISSRFMCPPTGPLLHTVCLRPISTALRSCFKVRTKRSSEWIPVLRASSIQR